MHWRALFGVITLLGVVLLIWDLFTIGSKETRVAPNLSQPEDESATNISLTPSEAET